METLRTQETIIYGGAFNPPTLAHVAILRACVEYAEINQADIWVMPSGDREDKTIAVPRERRLEYARAMVDDIGETTVSTQVVTSELDRTVMVETYDTVQELRTEYPEREFTFVFGADSTQTMHEWKGGDELLETLPMLVVERAGTTINSMARRAVRLAVETPNVSSTLVRACLEHGEPVADFVSPRVASLLR